MLGPGQLPLYPQASIVLNGAILRFTSSDVSLKTFTAPSSFVREIGHVGRNYRCTGARSVAVHVARGMTGTLRVT